MSTANELEKAKSAYSKAGAAGKKMLEGIFGKEPFAPKPTDRVKTFEDACKIVQIHPVNSLPYKKPKGAEEEVLNAYAKLRIIAKALNQGWTPDWSDSSQYKYYPWFRMANAGSGLSYGVCVLVYSYSVVASRLCFPNKELAEYFGKQFIDLHRIVMTK